MSNSNALREIVLDTETTGLSTKQKHRIIEIGCVELLGGVPTGNVFHKYINPEREIDEEAFKVHGISNEFVKQFSIFSKIAEDFLRFIDRATLIIHNATFDIKFLNYELKLIGKMTLSNPVIDTLTIAREKFPGSPVNLNALCRAFDIDLSKRTLHGALLDAQLLTRVYIELTGENQTKFNFSAENNHNEGKNLSPAVKYRNANIPVKRIFSSKHELCLHEALIEKIGNSLWKNFN